jgi:hypothetical protein
MSFNAQKKRFTTLAGTCNYCQVTTNLNKNFILFCGINYANALVFIK